MKPFIKGYVFFFKKKRKNKRSNNWRGIFSTIRHRLIVVWKEDSKIIWVAISQNEQGPILHSRPKGGAYWCVRHMAARERKQAHGLDWNIQDVCQRVCIIMKWPSLLARHEGLNYFLTHLFSTLMSDLRSQLSAMA